MAPLGIVGSHSLTPSDQLFTKVDMMRRGERVKVASAASVRHHRQRDLPRVIVRSLSKNDPEGRLLYLPRAVAHRISRGMTATNHINLASEERKRENEVKYLNREKRKTKGKTLEFFGIQIGAREGRKRFDGSLESRTDIAAE